MLVAANLVRQAHNLDGERQILGCDTFKYFFNQLAIPRDQRALLTADRRIAEGIDGRSTQTLHPGEQPQRSPEPRAKLQLLL